MPECIPPDARMHSMARRSYDERRGLSSRATFSILTSVSMLVIGSCQRKLPPHEPWFVRRVRKLMRKLVRFNPSERRRRVVGQAPFRHIGIDGPARKWSDTLLAGDGGVASHATRSHTRRKQT